MIQSEEKRKAPNTSRMRKNLTEFEGNGDFPRHISPHTIMISTGSHGNPIENERAVYPKMSAQASQRSNTHRARYRKK
jgi:hypothetical protein